MISTRSLSLGFRAGSVFFLSFLLLGAGLKSGELVRSEAVTYRAEGLHFQKMGQLQDAPSAFQKAVEAYPRYSEAYNDLGVVLEALGNGTAAQAAYLLALQIDPRFGAAYSNLAAFYEREGKIKEASVSWTARVKMGPPADPWVQKAVEKLKQYRFPLPVEEPRWRGYLRQPLLELR